MDSILNDIIKSAPLGIIATDSSGVIIAINNAAEKLLKIRGNRVAGSSISGLKIFREIINLLPSQEGRIIHRINGQEFLISRSPLLFSEKQTKGIIYTFQDLSGLDVAWIQQYCNLDALIEGAYDGIIIANNEIVLKVNNSFLRISGLKKEDIEGKSISHLANSSHVCLRAIYEVSNFVKRQKKSVTIMRKMRSGNEIYVTGAFVKCEDTEYCIVNIRDITELQHLREQVSRLTALYLSTAEDNQFVKLIGEDVVIESPAMKRLVELTIRVARTDSVILIQGESGTGKEVLARLIHSLSSRNRGPFISINCGAIPENLLESELFGYEKGSFTGASQDGKPGLFEMANKGTVFLDEIAEMPMGLQVKLLRVLQDKEVYRLGGVRPVRFDVRIIAATNSKLRDMVGEGKFREDLFYRLYVVPIEVPPLRERREDIFPLAWHYLKQYNQKYKQSKSFSSELIRVFESYSWPGNVRELQNIVERLVITSDTEILKPEHLPHHIYQNDAIADKPLIQINEHRLFRGPQKVSDFLGCPSPLSRAKEQVERTMLEQALKMKRTTREIADLLGIDHSTVVRKIQKYGLYRRSENRGRRSEARKQTVHSP